MNKFGTIKNKVLHKITESYTKGDKKEIKDILKTIKKDENFKGLYLFYEHVENRYIENRDDAVLFVNSIVPLLQEETKAALKTSKLLNESLKEITVTGNNVYDDLDTLAEQDTLLNVDKKVFAKLRLIEHLMSKKEEKEPKEIRIVENEALLHSILVNNFNVLYDNTLNEEEKKELSEILGISENDLKTNFATLKEETSTKIQSMIIEEKNPDIIEKLSRVAKEMDKMNVTKLNYYKLSQLKKGL